jgi:hypothetical protein
MNQPLRNRRPVQQTKTERRCPTCEGAGELTVNRSARRDPQCDEPASCPDCIGGWIRFVPVDALLKLAHERRDMRLTGFRHFYREARATAMRPVRLGGAK